MGNLTKCIGSKIKEARKARKLTQIQLAEKINVDPKYLSRIETGFATPSLKTIERIVEILQADIGQLFDFAEYKQQEEVLEELQKKMKVCPPENLKLILDFTNIIITKKISRY